jgi:aspartate aminotransferase
MSTQLSQALSPLISGIEPSLTMSITALANKLKAEGKDVIGFGAGEPDFDTPEPIKQAAIKAINNGKSKYTPAAGLPDLKQAIINRLQADYGVEYAPNNIVVSCGAKHSLHNVFLAILSAGDQVLVPAPYWVSYPEQIRLAGATMVSVSTSSDANFKVTTDQLEAAFTDKTKAIVLNSPSNPTGSVYTRQELTAIAEWAVQKNIWIISDEIYDKLVYGDEEHVCMASLSPEVKARTILINGVSKSYAMTGWRIGYFAAPTQVAQAVSRLQSHTTSNPTSISQYAAIEAFSMDQSVLNPMKAAFSTRRDLMVQTLQGIEGIQINQPSGAFYAFPKIEALFGTTSAGGKNITDSLSFCEALLEEAQVACVPGIGFGAEGYMRLSYATSEQVITEGLARIATFVAALSK